jgi:RNA polymerase sigma factor (sigma-70 family)
MWVNTIAKHMYWSRFRTPPAVAMDGAEGAYQMELEPIDVRRLLDACGPEERELLERHYLDGYTAEEIGRNIGLTAAGIRVRLLRLRRSLRQRVITAAQHQIAMEAA